MARSTKINPVSADLDRDQYIDGMLSSFAWDAPAFVVAPWDAGIVYKESTITYSFPDTCSTTEAITAMSLAQILRL